MGKICYRNLCTFSIRHGLIKTHTKTSKWFHIRLELLQVDIYLERLLYN